VMAVEPARPCFTSFTRRPYFNHFISPFISP
jgi:hypothetical protein